MPNPVETRANAWKKLISVSTGNITKESIYTLLSVPKETVKFDVNGNTNADNVGLSGDGIPFISSLITRDFYGAALVEDERFERCIAEVKRMRSSESVSLSIKAAQNYSLDGATFIQELNALLSDEYDEVIYSPDLTGRHCRFMFSSTAPWSFRWLLGYFIQQGVTND